MAVHNGGRGPFHESRTGAGAISPLAIQQRDGAYIRDRAGDTIQLRS